MTMDAYHQAEQNLLFGVLDALPCPAALLNRRGEVAYVNPRGAACRPDLSRCRFSALSAVQAGLRGETPPAGVVSLEADPEEHPDGGDAPAGSPEGALSGLLEVYPVQVDGLVLGALLMLRPDVVRSDDYDTLPYASAVMVTLRERLARLSVMGIPSLFLGEEGTGRAAFAHALHNMGSLAKQPFTPVLCRTGDTLSLEQALFGDIVRPGALRKLSGTAFLDNVDGLPPGMQQRLSELMKRRAFPDGMPLLVRVSASGPPDLEDIARQGGFDSGLYARLSVMPVRIPPLRERPEDILPLAEHFLRQYSALAGAAAASFSEEARHMLVSHTWPGNLRALEDAVMWAVGSCHDGVIQPTHLPFSSDTMPIHLQEMRSGFVKQRIEESLSVHGHTVEGKRRAAKELGIGLSTLYRLISKD